MCTNAGQPCDARCATFQILSHRTCIDSHSAQGWHCCAAAIEKPSIVQAGQAAGPCCTRPAMTEQERTARTEPMVYSCGDSRTMPASEHLAAVHTLDLLTWNLHGQSFCLGLALLRKLQQPRTAQAGQAARPCCMRPNTTRPQNTVRTESIVRTLYLDNSTRSAARNVPAGGHAAAVHISALLTWNLHGQSLCPGLMLL